MFANLAYYMKDCERYDISFAVETMKVFETFNAWRDGVSLPLLSV